MDMGIGMWVVMGIMMGAMWPTSYALRELTPAEEKKIAALVRKAVS